MSDAPMSRPGETAGWPKLVVKYTTDEANIAPLLPPGLQALDPTVTVGVYCIPVLNEPEFGISVKIAASWNGVEGQYNLGMGIDQEAAVHISGELNGQPKFLCDIDFFRLGDTVGARATHQGYTFVEYSGSVASEGDLVAGDFTEHEWWTKYSRAIGGA
jgi:acetoacetate decarboxylase